MRDFTPTARNAFRFSREMIVNTVQSQLKLKWKDSPRKIRQFHENPFPLCRVVASGHTERFS